VQRINLTDEIKDANNALNGELQRAALFALTGERLGGLPADMELPSADVVLQTGRHRIIEEGGELVDTSWAEMKGDFPKYCSRYAIVAMVTSCELHLRRLLFIASLGARAQGRGDIKGEDFYSIREEVRRTVRRSSVDGLVSLILETAGSDATVPGVSWFRSIYDLRVCLVHRGGVVGSEDVNEEGELKAVWRRVALKVDGEEVTSLPFRRQGGGEGQAHVFFTDEERSWKVGEEVQLNAQDCQHIYLSLYAFCQDVGVELNRGLEALQESAAQEE